MSGLSLSQILPSEVIYSSRLKAGGKPSTWFPPEGLLELCFNFELNLEPEKYLELEKKLAVAGAGIKVEL